MFSLFTSYLPPLPSLGLPLSLPQNLQPRLLRFLLRKAVGKFVKGGLNLQGGETDQVEADLGRGSVSVRELELDPAAIEPFLTGLPIEFVSGSIGQVCVQVDWPLSFSSGVAINLAQLSLILAVKQKQPTATSTTAPTSSSNPFSLGPNPSSADAQPDPLSAAASEFVHDDLSAYEDAELRASLCLEPSVSDLGDSFRLPGAFGGQERSPGLEEEQGQEVTLLASLLAGLLARLKVRVEQVTVRLVLPLAEGGEHETELELVVDSIAYADEPGLGEGRDGHAFRRTVRMSPPVVRLRLPTAHPPPTGYHTRSPSASSAASSPSAGPSTRLPSPATSQQLAGSIPSIPSPSDSPRGSPRVLHSLSPPPVARTYAGRSDSDSSSSSDESVSADHDMMMSQSIADMRTSFVSTQSGGESLYASALAGTMAASRLDPLEEDAEEDSPFFDPDSGSPQIPPDRDQLSKHSPESTPVEADPFEVDRNEPDLPPDPAEEQVRDDGFRTIVSFGHDELVLVLSPQSADPNATQPVPPSPSDVSTASSSPSRAPTPSSTAPLSPTESLSPPSPASPPPAVAALPRRLSSALAVSFTLPGATAIVLLPSQLAALATLVTAISGSGGASAQPAPAPARAAQATPAGTRSQLTIAATVKAVNLVIGLSPSIERLPLEVVQAFFAHPSTFTVSGPHLRLKLDGLALGVATGTTSASLRAFALTEALFDGSIRPLAISDANLMRQYDPEDDFPRFESSDWVGDKAAEARGWKLRAAQLARGRRQHKDADKPALAFSRTEGATHVAVGALHLFADLTVLHRLQPFVDFATVLVPKTQSTPQAAQTGPPPVQPLTPAVPPAPQLTAEQANESGPSLDVSCELARLSVRVPSPAAYLGLIRSGIATVDLHGLSVQQHVKGLKLSFNRVGAFFLRGGGVGGTHAVGFLSLTALGRLPNTPPSITPPSTANPVTTIHLPLLLVKLNKATLDGLQLFVDDLSQWAADRSAGSPTPTEVERGPRAAGGDARILGSAYFGTSRRSATEGSESSDEADPQLLEKGHRLSVKVSEVSVELLVGKKASTEVRRLRANATELDVAVHTGSKEEGDLQLDLQIADVGLEDASDGQPVQQFLVRTAAVASFEQQPTLPLVKLVFSSSVERDTGLKESKIHLTLSAFTYFLDSDLGWTNDLARFAKAPAGAFETVVPNELTRIRLRVLDGSVHVTPPTLGSRLVLHIDETKLATNLMPDLPRTRTFVELRGLHALAIDSADDLLDAPPTASAKPGAGHWKQKGFVQLLDLERCALEARQGNGLVLPDFELEVLEAKLSASLCADSLASVQALAADFAAAHAANSAKVQPMSASAAEVSKADSKIPKPRSAADLLASVDSAAFAQAAAMPDAPEDLNDDVPTNFDYLADALQQKGSPPPAPAPAKSAAAADRAGVIISDIGGETIKMHDPRGIVILDDFLAEPRVDPAEEAIVSPASVVRCRLSRCEVSVHIHEGYDWHRTRAGIAAEAKAVRKRLEKIRQLLASGQQPDASAEHASVLLFGAVPLGLPPGAAELPGPQLLQAIEDELERGEHDTVLGLERDDDALTATGSSWQSLPDRAKLVPGVAASARPSGSSRAQQHAAVGGKGRRRLSRTKQSAIEVVLKGISASFDSFPPENEKSSRLKVEVTTFEILDHLRTSTWRKFLTELRASDGGVVRASGAPMVRLELDKVWPKSVARGEHRARDAQEEIVLKMKLFPLRLYIDQDALDFLKAFGAFKVPSAAAGPPAAAPSTGDSTARVSASSAEPFFQRVEILPIKIKLDYKPKRVDYHALRRGKTAELMNFFHFDGSEITLRHLVVTGIAGGGRLSELVQDIWTPDVTSHQLADVLSGIAPVKSVVNVGSGVANLVLLPIEQYRKDGRLVRGLQKGAHAFAKQTTIEALSVGARLATGTQGLLEQAEGLLNGGRQSSSTATAGSSAGPGSSVGGGVGVGLDGAGLEGSVVLTEEERAELISRYAEQPNSLRGGLEAAYSAMGSNLREAAQTILAVPMEVYERSGSEGPVRAVVRAVPIAVLRPMIGGAEAVSKALFGLRNSLDPEAVREAEVKYKPRGGGG